MPPSLLLRVVQTSILGHFVIFLWLAWIDSSSFWEAASAVSLLRGSKRITSVSNACAVDQRTSSDVPALETTYGGSRVMLVFCTSNATLWSRVPMYTSTLLSQGLDFRIYSEVPGSIAGVPVLSGPMKSTAETIDHSVALLDAYNSTRGQGYHWFVAMNDDSYIFWENLLERLKRLNASDAVSLGYSGSDQGSTVAVMSSGALASSFAAGQADPEHGNARDQLNTNDGSSQAGFNIVPLQRLIFSELTAQDTLISIQTPHPSDVSAMWELQKRHHATRSTITYGSIFADVVWPGLPQERENWNNGAAEQMPPFAAEADSTTKAKEQCRQACVDWDGCLMWRYDTRLGRCLQDSQIALGASILVLASEDENTVPATMISGWMLERAAKRLGVTKA